MSNRVNLIETLGITFKEDIISNLLVALIRNSAVFRMQFFTNIASIPYESNSVFRIDSRIATSVGIPDIVAVIEEEDRCTLLIIENKLKAEEGYQQTLRYASPVCIAELKDKFGIADKIVELKLLFLTLVPETMPTSDDFINVSYEELIQKVVPDVEDAGLQMLYEDLSAVLSSFYSNLEVEDDDLLFDKFTENTDPVRLKIRFCKLIDHIDNFPEGFSRSRIGEVAGAGRINYLVKFSQDGWKGADALKNDEGKFILNENTFDIHVEFTFDPFHQVFALPLHYETNPYLSKKLIQNQSVGAERYFDKRDKVKQALHQKIKDLNEPSIKCFNGSNQIANFNMDLDKNTTVKAFKMQLAETLEKISELVNGALKEVQAQKTMSQDPS